MMWYLWVSLAAFVVLTLFSSLKFMPDYAKELIAEHSRNIEEEMMVMALWATVVVVVISLAWPVLFALIPNLLSTMLVMKGDK